MTRDRLKKLKALIKEAEHLWQLLQEPVSCSEYVADSYKDYKTGYPVIKSLAGYGEDDFVETRQKYYGKHREIQSEIAFLEDWLDSVDDPELRDILRLQYINGLTQEQIAAELGYSVITIKRRLRDFWKVDTE